MWTWLSSTFAIKKVKVWENGMRVGNDRCRYIGREMSGLNDGVKPGSARFDNHLHVKCASISLLNN